MTTITCIYINTIKFEETIKFYQYLLGKEIELKFEDRWAQINIDDKFRLAFLNVEYDRKAISEGNDIEKNYNKEYIANIPKEIYSGTSIVLNLKTDNIKKEYERVKDIAPGYISKMQYVNYMFPYNCFHVKDPEGNIIEIADA